MSSDDERTTVFDRYRFFLRQGSPKKGNLVGFKLRFAIDGKSSSQSVSIHRKRKASKPVVVVVVHPSGKGDNQQLVVCMPNCGNWVKKEAAVERKEGKKSEGSVSERFLPHGKLATSNHRPETHSLNSHDKQHSPWIHRQRRLWISTQRVHYCPLLPLPLQPSHPCTLTTILRLLH